jgi:CHAT domain
LTGFEIAWELLPVDRTGEAWEGLLGALLPVSRWCRTSDSAGLGSEPLDACTGRIIALVHEGLKWRDRETGLFNGRPATLFGGFSSFRDVLREDVVGVGLVYLACHGIAASKDLDGRRIDWALEGNTPKGPVQMKLGDLFRVKLKLLARSGSLVFLNMCESGRILRSENLGDTMLRGFVVKFLQSGARGVIGTLGDIDSSTAAGLTDVLLSEWVKDTTHTIAEQLQRFRAAAVEAMPQKPSAIDFAPLVSAFLYVYYGNPRLRLHIKEAVGEAGE